MGIREWLNGEQQEPVQKRDPEDTGFIRWHQKLWLGHNIAISVIHANRQERPVWKGEASKTASEFECTWQGDVYLKDGKECWGYAGMSDKGTYHSGLFVAEGDISWTTGWGKAMANENEAKETATKMSKDWLAGNDREIRKQLLICPPISEHDEKSHKGGRAMPSRNWRPQSWDR